MREFELVVDEALRNGLSPIYMTPFNSQYLKELLGFRLGELGPEKYVLGENPLSGLAPLLYSWPFPQFITGERYNFLIVRDSDVNHEDVVYSVDDNFTTATHIFSVDQLTFGQGTLMEVADFGEYAFMTNGVIMIFWDPSLGAWNKITSSSVIPMMRTVCNFKGQLVGGNVVSAWHDCDEKFYVWSKIGQMDFTPDNYNLAGYRRDPYGGEVYHVRRLNDVVIGYSSKGITSLNPVSIPIATYGFTELDDIGLINQGAMNGSLREHVYVGRDRKLRKITKQGIEVLGYEYYMEQLGEIIVSYNHSDFYIGDDEKTFLLTPNGLSEIPQHPSAVWGDVYETYVLPDTADSNYYMTIATHPFDMGYGGQKTIFSMDTDLMMGYKAEVAVDYYLNQTEYSTSKYVPLNNQNIASIIASGNAFGLRLRCRPDYDDFRIGYLKARYKMNDLRGIRGVYAPPPRGQ
jgi:hypothetical protein